MKVAETTFSLNEIHALLREREINPDSKVGRMVIAVNFERMLGVSPTDEIRSDEPVFVETKNAIRICPLVFGLALEIMEKAEEKAVEAKRKADEAEAKAKEARNAVPSVSAAIQQAVIQLNHDQKESSAA